MTKLILHAPFKSLPQENRGVVMLVEHNRSRLKELDAILSARGYSVISMTRLFAQALRLARALHPCAILLEWGSEGIGDFVNEFDDVHVDMQPILVFSRTNGTHTPGTLEHATNVDLVRFVESRSDRQASPG